MLKNFQLPIERSGQPEIVVIQEAHVFRATFHDPNVARTSLASVVIET
jgi:hypothetical protein